MLREHLSEFVAVFLVFIPLIAVRLLRVRLVGSPWLGALRLQFHDVRARLRQKFVRRMPPTPISDLVARETVRVDGAAEPSGELLMAPLSRKPCIAYRVVLSNAHEKAWRLSRELGSAEERFAYSSAPFELEQKSTNFYVCADDTSVLVRSASAKLLELGRLSEYQSFNDTSAPDVDAFLRSQGIVASGDKTTVVREYVLLPRKQVSIVGNADRTYCSSPFDGGYRGLATQWVLNPAQNGELVVTEN